MTTVGAYEARTRLPKLLERVRKGERITITKRGVPVAVLAPPSAEVEPVEAAVGETIEAFKEFRRRRKGRGFTADEIKELIEEGQRF